MPTDIDSLQIQINAQASKANDAIDRLVGKIDKLTTSLAKVDGSKITGLANGVQRLGTAMQTMNTVKTADFTRLATNLTKLGSVNVSALNSAASSMSHLTRAFNNLGTVSVNATAVGDLAKNIGKLGNKSVQTAVANIPQLATALNGLMTTLSKAPSVSQNVIQMTNALANLTAQGSRVGSASNSIVKGLNRASSSATRANKSFKGLASTLGKFYANCFLMIRGLKGLWNSINSTADYLEAFNYFEVALNKVGGDWASRFEQYGYASAEEYANSFKTRLNESLKGLSGVQISIDANGKTGLLTDTGMKNLGLNIQEVTQYASQLASVTNSVGQTGEVTLATASAFTKLGADMSSLFNTDYSTVMNNLQSAIIGQSRAVYKYGSDITNASLQTLAYSLNIEKSVSEMTQAEKMQLRIIKILQDTKVAWGDQANTINSLSNSIRQFKNNISEAGQILGQLFVPIMSKLMPIINGVTIAIKRLMVSVAGIMGIKLDLSEFGQGTSDITDDMDGLSESIDGVVASVEKAKKGLRGFDELNVISTPSDSGNDTSASVGGLDLTQQILDATAEYEAAWQEAYERMENKAMAFADKIEKSLEPIKKIFQDFAVGDFFQAGQDVSNLVVSITDFFARAIDNVDWYGIGMKIGDFLEGVDWTSVLSSIGDLIWQAIKASIEQWQGMFDAAPIETTILTGIATLKFANLSLPGLLTEISNAVSKVKISEIVLTVGKWTFSSPVGAEIGLKIIEELENFITAHFGEKVLTYMGESLTILTTSGIGFIFGGPIGALAGAIIGLFIDAFSTDGYARKVLNAIAENVFNFSDAKYFFDKMKENFTNALNGSNIFEVGANIVEGILNGMVGTLVGIAEPFVDLFNWVVDGICDLFGIRSPAKETEFIGKNIVLGIAEGFTAGFKALKEKFKELWNGIADFLNEKMSFTIDPITILGKTVFAGATIDLGFIPRFENGGYVTPNMPNRYSILMAGENGIPEIAGTVGGRTAVAGGAEITGISDTIRATSNEEIALLRQQNALLQALLEKEVGISKNEIGKAAQSWARDYSRRTGRDAYSF